MTDVRFGIIVTSKKVGPLGPFGTRFWVCDGDWGPEGRYVSESTLPPLALKTFANRTVAEMFAKNLEGHPWWVKPESWEIIEVCPVYKQVLAGYERRDAA